MMSDDLRKRLQRLGVTSGHEFKFAHSPAKKPRGIEALIEGTIVEIAGGECFMVSHVLPLSNIHGPHQLGDWNSLSSLALAAIGNDRQFESVESRQLLFLDTETTGLGGGAIAFLVGIGYFNEIGGFVVEQYFLRDPAEEPAMLTLLEDRLSTSSGLVTFNGRTFDVPLMGGRFIRNRMPTMIESLPNLDLLSPARRLWKRRLPSCSLGALEVEILGIRRTGEDISGYLIPALYNDYLRTGDATNLTRVFYHNREDILSMVSLGITLARAFSGQTDDLHVDDRLSLARWYHAQGLLAECEAAYRTTLDEVSDEESLQTALRGLAYLLKGMGRRDDALPYWERLADLKSDVLGYEELAKHYEWHQVNLMQALEWTERGLSLAQSWRPGIRQRQALHQLTHRQARLQRKLNGQELSDDQTDNSS